MYYKDYLPVIRRDDLSALGECIVNEINLGKILLLYTCNYNCPSQTTGKFQSYCQNLHLALTNIDDSSPFPSVFIGDFNVGCSNWWTADSKADKDLATFTSTVGQMQLINKLSPFFSGGSFRIDPVFCNKSDMVSDCEIDRFLIQTCHLFLQRSMLKLCSPSYSREV